MGWQGGGLGQDERGVAEPVSIWRKKGRRGLGHGSSGQNGDPSSGGWTPASLAAAPDPGGNEGAHHPETLDFDRLHREECDEALAQADLLEKQSLQNAGQMFWIDRG